MHSETSLKVRSLEWRDVYCKANQGERNDLYLKDLKSLTVFWEDFIGKMGGGG